MSTAMTTNAVRRLSRVLAVATALTVPAAALAQQDTVDLDWETEIGAWRGACAEGSFLLPTMCAVRVEYRDAVAFYVQYRLLDGEPPRLALRVRANTTEFSTSGPLAFIASDGNEVVIDQGYIVVNGRAAEVLQEEDVAAVMGLLESGVEGMTVSVPLETGSAIAGDFDLTGFEEAFAALTSHVGSWQGE